VSGTDEAVFARCKSMDALQHAVDSALREETWSAKRIDIADVQFSPRGWAMLTPIDLGFFLETGDSDEIRLVRFARALGAPVYQVDVRSSVSVTLLEADATGRLRVSGKPLWSRNKGSAGGLGSPVKETIGFGLLPVTPAIRERLENLADDPRVAEYLGDLAGFAGWRRRQERDGEPLAFSARAGAPVRRAPSAASDRPATPAPRGTPPAPAKVRRAPASPGRTTRKRPSAARAARSR